PVFGDVSVRSSVLGDPPYVGSPFGMEEKASRRPTRRVVLRRYLGLLGWQHVRGDEGSLRLVGGEGRPSGHAHMRGGQLRGSQGQRSPTVRNQAPGRDRHDDQPGVVPIHLPGQ
ncbi:unnamed protein product, partial [Ectocarpus sp. 8 AP-2014]